MSSVPIYHRNSLAKGMVSIIKYSVMNSKHLTIASRVQGIIDLTVPAGGSSLSVKIGEGVCICDANFNKTDAGFFVLFCLMFVRHE